VKLECVVDYRGATQRIILVGGVLIQQINRVGLGSFILIYKKYNI